MEVKKTDFPADIPKAPSLVYKNLGWVGFGDWLGTGTVATFERMYKPFEEARKLVRSKNLKSQEEWREHTKSDDFPANIPKAPWVVYKNLGWVGFGDWLGTGTVATSSRMYKPFEEARELVRSKNLKSRSEWNKYTKSDDFPADIPKAPWVVYKNSGWVGLGDWLGTGTVATSSRMYKPFEEARKLVRSKNLKSEEEWKKYTKSDDFPADIPKTPWSVYKDKGWISYKDWLGN
jgi:hypothetical protein